MHTCAERQMPLKGSQAAGMNVLRVPAYPIICMTSQYDSLPCTMRTSNSATLASSMAALAGTVMSLKPSMPRAELATGVPGASTGTSMAGSSAWSPIGSSAPAANNLAIRRLACKEKHRCKATGIQASHLAPCLCHKAIAVAWIAEVSDIMTWRPQKPLDTWDVVVELWSCLGRSQLSFQPGAALAQEFQVGIRSRCCSPLVPQLGICRRQLLAYKQSSRQAMRRALVGLTLAWAAHSVGGQLPHSSSKHQRQKQRRDCR